MRGISIHIILLLTCFALQAQEVHFPDIPSNITDSGERSLYLAEHFWERNDLGDTLLIHHPTVVFDYVYILSKIPQEEACRLMIETARQALCFPKTYSYTEYWFEHYLHDSLSPYYNDELFIPFLETVCNSECDELLKMRSQFLLSRCKMNRVGQPATDFVLHTDGGQEKMLSQIKAEYIILWFFQNGCGACSESAEYLKNSETAQSAFGTNDIILIPINVEKNPDLVGNLYELQYYPVFYVIGKDRTIILKEASLDRVDAFLKSIIQQNNNLTIN